MAAGTQADFIIRQDEFFAGMTDTLQQNTEAFNGASANAIRLVAQRRKGDYDKESFFTTVANLITRRDTSATTAVTDGKLAQAELIGVKVNRKIGPVANTLDAFRKIAQDSSTLSLILGRQTGKAVAVDYVNAAVGALKNALAAQATLVSDGTAATISHKSLNTAFSLFGDAASRISAIVMHSKVYFDLIGQAITDNVFQVGGVTIVQGNVATFGRPVVVTDAADLKTVDGGGPGVDHYHTLALVPGSAVIEESEGREIVSDTVTGLENLLLRIQGEYAFNLKLAGMQWDVANGGANPTDAALKTGTNWDKIVADDKSLPGVVLNTL